MIITVTVNPSVDRLYKVKKLIPGQLNRVKVEKHMVGGKGFNAGRVCALLNSNTKVFGFIGGQNGQFIRSQSYKDKYDTWYIDTKVETRNCLQVIDDNGIKTEINENGLPIKEKYFESLINSIKGCLVSKNIKAISLNGSLPAGSNYTFYIELIKTIRKNKPNCKVVLDTSGTIMAQIINSGIYPDIIKPNEHEIATFLKKKVTTDPSQLIYNIKNNSVLMKINTIFVSLGSHGCLIKHNNNFYFASFNPVKAVNTEGSGDAMVGGILAAIDHNVSIVNMIRWAVAAGTANAMNLKTGFIDKNTFDSLVSTINLNNMN